MDAGSWEASICCCGLCDECTTRQTRYYGARDGLEQINLQATELAVVAKQLYFGDELDEPEKLSRDADINVLVEVLEHVARARQLIDNWKPWRSE